MPLVIPPLGVSPLGMFAPATFPSALAGPPGVIADQVDWQTREVVSLTRGMHPIDEQVMTALTTTRESGAVVTNVGNRFVDVTKLDQTATMRLESEVRIALRRLIERRDITLLAVKGEADGDAAAVTAQWRNLRALNAQLVRTGSTRGTFNIAGALR